MILVQRSTQSAQMKIRPGPSMSGPTSFSFLPQKLQAPGRFLLVEPPFFLVVILLYSLLFGIIDIGVGLSSFFLVDELVGG